MRACSASSIQTDAYRAGLETGEGLCALKPEVVLLFSSIHYEHDFGALFEGLRDGLGSSATLIFGGTGDGIYGKALATSQGVSALGLNSEGQITWTVEIEADVESDSFATANRCGQHARASLGGQADFAFLMSTGKTSDGNRLIAGFQAALPIPIVGGLAGDDRKFLRAFVFAGDQAHANAVGVLAGRGPLKFLLSAASGWKPVGEPGYVAAAHGNIIERIGDTTALAFMRERMGKSPSKMDVGMVPLATTVGGAESQPALRTASALDSATGTITVMGGVPVGARVQVCEATRAEVVGGVDDALRGLPLDTFMPVAALVVSCAGRSWVMGDRGQEELARLQATLGSTLPLAGFPSFGEICPFRRANGTYTPTQFHNVTFALCLIGA